MTAIQELYTHFISRTERLTSTFNKSLAYHPVCVDWQIDVHRQNRMFCIVRLQYLWGEFCRELLLRSSIGKCYTIDGTYLPQVRGIRSPDDFEVEARRISRGQQYIAWHVPGRAADIVKGLSPANEMQITTALSSVSPSEDVRRIRNYIVHPNKGTRMEFSFVAQSLGIFDSDPDLLLRDRVSRSSVTRFEDWVIQLQIVALNAAR